MGISAGCENDDIIFLDYLKPHHIPVFLAVTRAIG